MYKVDAWKLSTYALSIFIESMHLFWHCFKERRWLCSWWTSLWQLLALLKRCWLLTIKSTSVLSSGQVQASHDILFASNPTKYKATRHMVSTRDLLYFSGNPIFFAHYRQISRPYLPPVINPCKNLSIPFLFRLFFVRLHANTLKLLSDQLLVRWFQIKNKKTICLLLILIKHFRHKSHNCCCKALSP